MEYAVVHANDCFERAVWEINSFPPEKSHEQPTPDPMLPPCQGLFENKIDTAASTELAKSSPLVVKALYL